jgi:hypothetical protein
MTDRLEDQQRLWRRVHKAARKYECEGIWVLGDLFDNSKTDAVTLTTTTECLTQDPDIDKYLLPGNHDANTIHGGRFTLEAYGAMGLSHVKYVGAQDRDGEHAGYYCVSPRPWLNFWCMEYASIKRTREILAAMHEKLEASMYEGVNVLLMHNSVLGCSHVGWVCDNGLDAEEVCRGFTYVLSGHFHDHQLFGDNGMYLGAPMHHRYDDAGRRSGFHIVTFNRDGSRGVVSIKGNAPRFHTAVWPDAPAEDPKPRDYLRHEIHATHADYAAMLPEIREAVAAEQADGIRASYKHKPIYHHEERIESHGDTATLTMPAAVSAYADMADVATGTLDKVKLKELGHQALEAAHKEA